MSSDGDDDLRRLSRVHIVMNCVIGDSGVGDGDDSMMHVLDNEMKKTKNSV
jgi:hypothetical protein